MFVLVLTVSTGLETDTVNVEGLPYATEHNGVFILSGRYNGFPVYKSVKTEDWVIYKRKGGNGCWISTRSMRHGTVPLHGRIRCGSPLVEGIERRRYSLNVVYIITGSYNGRPVYSSLEERRYGMVCTKPYAQIQ